MCASVTGLYLDRRARDSTRAFRWADRPKGQLLALMYPEGFKIFHEKTCEERYIYLRRNLYGDPAACWKDDQQADCDEMADDTMEISEAYSRSRSSTPVSGWVCGGAHITIKEITLHLRWG
jgi:hypothetical protein